MSNQRKPKLGKRFFKIGLICKKVFLREKSKDRWFL